MNREEEGDAVYKYASYTERAIYEKQLDLLAKLQALKEEVNELKSLIMRKV